VPFCCYGESPISIPSVVQFHLPLCHVAFLSRLSRHVVFFFVPSLLALSRPCANGSTGSLSLARFVRFHPPLIAYPSLFFIYFPSLMSASLSSQTVSQFSDTILVPFVRIPVPEEFCRLPSGNAYRLSVKFPTLHFSASRLLFEVPGLYNS